MQSFFDKLNGNAAAIASKVLANKRISDEDALWLYTEAELGYLSILANAVRERLNGDKTYYNRNIHIEPTNICICGCKFCSYARKPGEAGSWEYSVEEMLRMVSAYADRGITEVHIVGGVHPQRDLYYYGRLIEGVKAILPHVHVKAFTAVELDFMIRKAELSLGEGLLRLKAYGLDSIPGGGAEIFDEDLRKEICGNKSTSEQWLNVHQMAHQLGIPSNATMLYGHIENYAQRVDHLKRLRSLQDETNGFNAFIPLKFKAKNNSMDKHAEVPLIEDLRNYAVSRIYLDNIPHLKAYWPAIGKDTTQLALSFGVDDIDGTIDDTTRIYSMAGAEISNPVMTAQEMQKLIIAARRIPVERDSLYNEIV